MTRNASSTDSFFAASAATEYVSTSRSSNSCAKAPNEAELRATSATRYPSAPNFRATAALIPGPAPTITNKGLLISIAP